MAKEERDEEREEREDEEPLSPTGRLMHAPKFNLTIILFMGYKTKIDPTTYKKCMQQTLLKHPRFSSILVTCEGKWRWRRTAVDIDNHVFVPDVGPAAAAASPDEFVTDFATNLSGVPMDATKPLWESYILNVKTSDAEAVVVMRIHHSIGDGVSLIALTHACSRRIGGDADMPPELPAARKRRKRDGGAAARLISAVWTVVLMLVYTLMDVTAFIATLFFLRDGETPIKARRGVMPRQTRFVHGIVSFDDVKLVKSAMNVSVNDVVLGVTEAGISRYLNSTYEKNKENGEEIKGKSIKSLPRNLSIRSTVVFNLRPSPTIENLVEMMEKEELNGMWGNLIAIVLLPISINLQEDPLKYIQRAKSTMDRKKLSLAHNCAFLVMKLLLSLFGPKAAALVTTSVFSNTTFSFSNVMGPKEEVNLFGHHLSYIAPSVYGFPQSFVVHYLSYGGKLVISIGADEELIPNPQLLCDDLIKSLQIIKEAVIKRGLIDASQLC